MNWHTRITQARTAKKLKKSELAKLIGVSAATITMWESGQTKRIAGQNLMKVCDVLEISPAWLLDEFGFGEAAADFEQTAQRYSTFHPPLAERQVVRFIPNNSLAGYSVEAEVDLDMPSMFALRYQWVWANGMNLEDALVTRVKSTDMEPALVFGDILVVNSTPSDLEDGSVYAVIYEGAVLFRRLQRDAGEWWLASDSADQRKYARKLYRPSDVRIIGKVVLRQTDTI
jgi:phage repressor protein C with HTH and peptisase S24 domain